MDAIEAIDKLGDEIDAAVARAEARGLTMKEILDELRYQINRLEGYQDNDPR